MIKRVQMFIRLNISHHIPRVKIILHFLQKKETDTIAGPFVIFNKNIAINLYIWYSSKLE